MAVWIKMPLGMAVSLGPGDFVLDGDPAPLIKKGAEPLPQFWTHVHCGQTALWIRTAVGTEVGLGPGGVRTIRTLDYSYPRLIRRPTLYRLFVP